MSLLSDPEGAVSSSEPLRPGMTKYEYVAFELFKIVFEWDGINFDVAVNMAKGAADKLFGLSDDDTSKTEED
jgi:hypothetical protein